MKKFTFIFAILIMCAQCAFSQFAPTPVNNPRWFKDYIIFSDTVRFGDTTTTHMRIMPDGKIYMIDNFILDNTPDSFLVRDNITGQIKLRSMTSALGDISFLNLNDTPDDYADHANTLTYVTGDADSLIFTDGLQWNVSGLDSTLLITSDGIGSGFSHVSHDFSSYAVFNYRNIGLTDGSYALNIYPNRIEPPNIRWNGGEEHLNWSLGETMDAEFGSVNWYFHPYLGGAGAVLADSLGDGHLRLMSMNDLETDPFVGSGTTGQIGYFNSSGVMVGNAGLLFDDSDYTFSIGNANPSNWNLNVVDPTGRCEVIARGFGAETQFKTQTANGSDSSPSALGATDPVGIYGFTGYDGTQWVSDVTAGMKAVTTEAWDASGHGTRLLWAVTPNNSTSLDIQMMLDETGLNIGSIAAHSYMLDVNGDVNIATGSMYKINGSNITTTNIAEGSNLYHTNERVDDEVDAVIVDGTNITTSYNDAGNALTINSSFKTIIGGNPSSVVAASTTAYAPIFSQNNFSTTESQRQMVMPFDGTASHLYLVLGTNQPASGNMVVTVRKNGVATALTFTIAANASAATFSDTTHSFTFVAGDKLSVECVNNATGNSGGVLSFSFYVQ